MKKHIDFIILFFLLLTFDSCQSPEQNDIAPANEIPPAVWQKLEAARFDVTYRPPVALNNGYLVEGDIYLTDAELDHLAPTSVPQTEHFTTNNLVTGLPRNISIYIATSFSTTYVTALNTAIARFNAENLRLTFTRATNSTTADIRITRLSTSQENSGIFGTSGFPTSAGNPYSSIILSGIMSSTYGFSTDGIASIITHEIGHCIGFRHTDMNLPTECTSGGEGSGGVGNANPVPGVPIVDRSSFMNSCKTGANRPFTAADKLALAYVY